MARRKPDKKKIIFYVIAIIAVALAAICRMDYADINSNLTLDENSIAVHFVDVGQGNCTIIQSGNEGVLIDAGEREASAVIVDFLKENGISHLEYVIATHPHSDHIGGMSTVLEYVDADEIYFPYIIDKYAATSKTYLNLLETVDRNDIQAHFIDENTVVKFGDVTVTIITPVEQVRDFNNMSLLTKIDYGKNSVMLLADAENRELESILNENKTFDFSADVYLAAHHGSNTSLHEEFLSKINARNAVISCGLDNSYGHPHIEVEKYLQSNNIRTFRTDEDGTVTFISNGNEYNITTEKGSE
ncbi:MAG: MBL fold metallo-hydrolase [Clostridia bacterium]|nr:MBL fold metallo-hydrolase [Clostridia bacterium]